MMLAHTFTDVLTHAANNGRAAAPVFTGHAPIPLASYDRLDTTDLETIADRLHRTGYAVTSCPQEPTQRAVTALAQGLGLGEPFVPPLYRRSGPVSVATTGVSTLTARAPHVAHPALSAGAQGLHTDGLLQPIGHIRTSILACVRPAAHGGESVLFNATGAFWHLAGVDPRAAAVLLEETVLGRQATVNGSNETARGPAFASCDGHLVTRYSRDGNDHWQAPTGQEEALRRALAAMDELAAPDSPFTARFALAPGQCLLLSNARISHGRDDYRDEPTAPRTMLRGLFTRDPHPMGAV